MRSDIVLPEFDVDAWLARFLRCIPGLRLRAQGARGPQAMAKFVVQLLASVAGSATAALGRARACEMVAHQFEATALD